MERGALRKKALLLVRQQGPCSASQVRTELCKDQEISLNAVQTVLNRLVEQGLLIRNGTRRHFTYEAKPSEETVKQRAEQAAMDLLLQSGDVGLAHFVDTLDKIQPDMVKKLEQVLEQRRTKGE
ncbi:BlaI/MecI/CopY family transcriptional regulator [Alicyclobacillus sp. SO9]|uniref:BlaI/MecI/CopY family transcriptional regulator n=1 Tax=Alicyclobacillus sp. SO9 TaxID=2665646 RepID=UPI0018E782A8|nr:BlaI/MecI/CopY family transcriptional regulator [Alicyclobacillus sp. SO9]QQE77643.1 BlaI/MecI/CopY family transcriptional regulator [Alicyclobacillus sp. SO9]